MKSFKNSSKSLKVPLLILGMVVLFSLAFNTVSAADTSQINVISSENGTNGHTATNSSTSVSYNPNDTSNS